MMKKRIYITINKKSSDKFRKLIVKLSGINFYYCEALYNSRIYYKYAIFEISTKLDRKLKLLSLNNNKSKSKSIQQLIKIMESCKKVSSDTELISYIKKIETPTPFRGSISTYNYSKMPTPPKKDNKKVDVNYREGNHTRGPSKYFCLECHFSFKSNDYMRSWNSAHINKNEHCPNCGVDNTENDKIVHLGSHVRVPRKNASNKIWKIFLERFVNK
jgi:hypothetical protein